MVKVAVSLSVYVVILFCRGIVPIPVFYAFHIYILHFTILHYMLFNYTCNVIPKNAICNLGFTVKCNSERFCI